MGESSAAVSGTRSWWSTRPLRLPLPSVVTAMIRPPRARTSCMFDSTLVYTSSFGATNTAGMFSSISAIGPCFISAAG